MRFRLRQIDHTADGRRIARDRLVERNELAIGRAGENDIHLPDLAVEPQHAVLAAAGGTQLTVQSVGTRGFMVDGKQVDQAHVDAATGAELRFGSTTITVSQGDDGLILLEIQGPNRQDKPDPAADKAGFSLAPIMPSKRGIGWALLTIILLVFLALPIASHLSHAAGRDGHIPGPGVSGVVGDKAWNPGELSLAHHALSAHCEACHQRPFEAVRNETCLSCHRDVHDHAPAARLAVARGPIGLGAATLQRVGHAFGREGPGACVDCHVEHQGMRAMDAPRQQLCADCHGSLKDRLTDSQLGNAGDFGTAHPQFRAWVVADAETRRLAPVLLDQNPKEDNGLIFSHQDHLDRLGGVAKMAITLGAGQGYGRALGCADCHKPTADGARFEPVSMERDCEACHSLAYARVGGTYLKLRHGDIPQMLAQLSMAGPAAALGVSRARPGDFAGNGPGHAKLTGVAAQAMAPNGICGECHKPELHGSQMGGGKLAVRPVTLVSRYMPNGWFDHAAHSQTQCSECHAAATSPSSADVLLPKVAECRSCHLGEAATKPKVLSSCAMCHAYHKTALAPVSPRGMGRRED